ncbi:MAG TPA: nucleoside-diphosphate sugar epimerase/dehydratase [Caldimonas sp.]
MSTEGGWIEHGLARLRPHRVPLTLAVDALVIVACWNFTYLFRLGFERWWSARPSYDLVVLVGVTAVYLGVLGFANVPRGMWRFSGFAEIKRLLLACLAAGAISAIAVVALGLREVPRSVLALHPVMTLMGLCTVRVLYRMFYEQSRARRRGGSGESRRAVVMGAGEAARLLLAGLQDQGWTVLALLDDDPAKQGARIGGVSVAGRFEDVTRHDVIDSATHIITAMPGSTTAQRRRAIELASATHLPVLTVPSIRELRDGGTRIERLRAIEPEDLLGRDPVELDESGVAALIGGRTVLVTGAGGSIGSELCRQIARHRPGRLVLFEQSELNLYTIDQALAERFPDLALTRLIGDVKDLEALRLAMAKWRQQLVFHAAAYKHVPLVEEGNAAAALQNNTLGTWRAAHASAEAGVERFVLISTDKAVNPTNVMGATKRAAEMAISRLARSEPQTRFMAVRFGNVLGSSGSVIPRFKEQIARGGPVTVTHPEITRYFMTVAEAARLVLQAAAIGETGRVYVLDMGEPMKIVDLARDLIRLAGQSPEDVPIAFTGLRPGEKLYEELLADSDRTLPTTVPELRIARLLDDEGRVDELLEAAERGSALVDDADVRAALRAAVPEYRPAEAERAGLLAPSAVPAR